MGTAETRSWDWDRIERGYWATPAPDVCFLLDRWKEKGYRNILDLGCGIGRHALQFAQRGFAVAATDLSPTGLRIVADEAARRGLAIETAVADVRKLPFEDGSFDAILAIQSIYPVDSYGMAEALAELRRVLGKKAEVYVTLISKTDPSYSDPESRVIDGNVRIKREEEGSELPHFFVDRNEIRRLLADYSILSLRHIEEISENRSSWHYFVHCAPRS
jgi:ubiquinone/menaquinone biosynthesis C-methylase UbiE